jgi:hypothetical protein
MVTERRIRPLLAAYLAATFSLIAVAIPARAATPSPGATPVTSSHRPVPAAEPWWVRLAFAGQSVLAVRAGNGTLGVVVSGHASLLESPDGGRTWADIFERHGLVIPAGPLWRIVGEHVGRVDGAGTFHPDQGSPRMALPGASPPDAHGPIAAPARLPGVVVAVDRDNVVWRRGADGGWARALLLLPQHIAAGPPRVTGVAAFETTPLSNAVYIGTDGYSVLESTDGGDDWIRAGPGLPDHVLGLASDDAQQAVYAATDDGLWVHHLQATPAPPSYPDAALHWRWLGVALVTLAAAAASIGGLVRVLR